MSYTISPVHNEDYFVKLANELEKMGADVICIKDMANLLLPYDAYTLVKRLKEEVSVPIHLHTHNTAGTGDMTYLKAIEAGVDIVDYRAVPAGKRHQPARYGVPRGHATRHGYDTGLDLGKMSRGRKALPRRG